MEAVGTLVGALLFSFLAALWNNRKERQQQEKDTRTAQGIINEEYVKLRAEVEVQRQQIDELKAQMAQLTVEMAVMREQMKTKDERLAACQAEVERLKAAR